MRAKTSFSLIFPAFVLIGLTSAQPVSPAQMPLDGWAASPSLASLIRVASPPYLTNSKPDSATIQENTLPLISGTPQNGSIPAAPPNDCLFDQTQYTFRAGCMHEVELRSGQNVDLYVRFGQRVTIEGGRIIADYVSQSPTGSESISIDLLRTPRDGTFFVAVSNCSPEAASYTLLYHQIICDPAPPPFITSCELKRNSTGAFYLVIKGERIRSVAMVTVGGVIPKKLRFKGPDEQGVFYRKIIAKGGICGSLPGTIVIIDSGPFPFFCSERCPY